MDRLKQLKQPVELAKADSALLKEIQTCLAKAGYYKIEIDGKYGPSTKAAFEQFKKDAFLGQLETVGPSTAEALLKLDTKKPTAKLHNLAGNSNNDDLASKIVRRMQALGMEVYTGKNEVNIVYLEGADSKGNVIPDRLDEWNDRRLVIVFNGDTPTIIGNWQATTEPGAFYTHNKLNSRGAARIAIDKQFKAWQVGIHGNSDRHEALVQTGGSVTVHRDGNKDGARTGDYLDTGYFGINQHWGFDMNNVGKASAGCLVGRYRKEHRDFMRLIKKDPRYLANKKFVFSSCVLDPAKL